MAQKIKEPYFPQIKNEFLNIIYIICINLPCPTCAEHAKKYMESIRYQTIQSKQQLKDMLFEFHNSVNQRKGVALFPYSQLDAKYNAAISSNILRNFMFHFKDKSHNLRMISQEMYRNMVVKQVTNWFSNNSMYFDA